MLKGQKNSPETILKMSLAKKGKPQNSSGHLGHKHSDETKRLYSLKRRGTRLGYKHPNWKGGITKINHAIRQMFEYRQWRSDVFTRDNFTCLWCNKRGIYLEADHFPKMFIEIINEYKIKTLEHAKNCQELWNINNGRTLCKHCHNKTKGGYNKKSKILH